MKRFLLLIILFGISFSFVSDYLLRAESLFSQLKDANAKEETPYLYGKVKGYYEAIKLYAVEYKEDRIKTLFTLMSKNTKKAVRGAYTEREPLTELITFEPRVYFEEYCDGIMDECFYEKHYEKEKFIELVDYFSLKRRVEFLRNHEGKYCAPFDFGMAEALFNAVSLELMQEKPDEKVLIALREKLEPILVMAEEKLRYAMKKELPCYRNRLSEHIGYWKP
ncbi:hypothetical protein [Aquifex aeolicus]|uniref:Uncharacterized protein aq_532 n=1 Tax=Aquifex aeolicus (strain VF5) TaxID=224324 RepID=Y532_AQUAE|nr:hypothetical protein [Aquifex aeolicus]O66814.1 RecName: Full=Uncharacterized protein aq_532; Flags: Precursor [Aquifex aeolicus VF5]AAC06777.1 putative protein [Aquifex aeolicus VF5]